MKERALENLIRMALEIDELDRSATRPEFTEQAAADVIAFKRTGFSSRLVRRLTVPLAAAIALSAVLLHTSRPVPPQQRGPSTALAAVARPFDIDFCPLESGHFGIGGGGDSNAYKVIAIFQTWRQDCECHAWQLYEWEDHRSLTEMTPEQIREIALNVTGASPVEQLLCVAIASNAADLPLCVPESCQLVDCLNDVAPPGDARESAVEYASAVRACLPESIRIVP